MNGYPGVILYNCQEYKTGSIREMMDARACCVLATIFCCAILIHCIQAMRRSVAVLYSSYSDAVLSLCSVIAIYCSLAIIL